MVQSIEFQNFIPTFAEKGESCGGFFQDAGESVRVWPFVCNLLVCFLVMWAGSVHARDGGVTVTHAVTLDGIPRYSAGFTHFDYVNPRAPKGGVLRDCAIGTFDSFNPYILKGRPAEGAGLVYDTLLVASDDEPSTWYGLAAEKIEIPDDLSWVAFHLNPNARFHDGHPVTADDVVFSFKMLMNNFGNVLKRYYGEIEGVEARGRLKVVFAFKNPGNRELPSIIGQIPVLPEHFWEGKDFSRACLDVPLGSGPYRIARFKAGKSVTYERVKDYWAKDLPVMKGRWNFDAIHYDYFRDDTVALEAFKAGLYDYRFEGSAKNWATMYHGPGFEKGEIRKALIPHSLPGGIQGLVFNTRRPLFQDRRVRRALMLAFDYEWANRRIYFGQYPRIRSYFSNSDLASPPLPEGRELEILGEFREELPKALFTTTYHVPETDGSGHARANLMEAAELLEQAGWRVRGGELVHEKSGHPFRFQFLSDSPAMEKLILPFRKNLRRLGIDMRIHRVDPPQYTLRLRRYDYDMIVAGFGGKPTPGSEQMLFWHSSSAMRADARNLAGIRNPVVDRLVERVVAAPDRETLVPLVHALDRVLLWGDYIIPFGASHVYRLAYRDKFGRPPVSPGRNPGISCWWVKGESPAPSERDLSFNNNHSGEAR